MTMLAQPAAAADRTLSFHNLHTGEDLTVTYKRNGQYVPEAMRQINHILRDWRRNEAIEMDPRLIDLVWEVVQRTGGHGVVQIVCGYRAPETNTMLRSNSSGVAENSQHMRGNALDFYLSGVDLATLRATGLQMQVGGVGYYPTSGWPFVHLDTGSVRMWPRMTTAQLQQVFPDGRSLYIPDNGRALPGYAEAQRAYEARGTTVVALFQAPVDEAGGGNGGGFGSRIAALFGSNDEPAAATPAAPAAQVAVAAAAPASVAPLTAPLPMPMPGHDEPVADEPVAAEPVATRDPILLADAVMAPLPMPNPSPAFDGVMLAFAGSEDAVPDPLALLTDTARTAMTPIPADPAPAAVQTETTRLTPPAVANAPARDWNDPFARLTPVDPGKSGLPLFDGSVTTRQIAFADFTAPNTYDSPDVLLDPERAPAETFDRIPGALRTSQFTGGIVPVIAMVDLTGGSGVTTLAAR
ncbi:MAG: DUF882 domain-containing protein [Bauldia sp.]|nr:DUF882 domain-containing protein [Bauldia sp.]